MKYRILFTTLVIVMLAIPAYADSLCATREGNELKIAWEAEGECTLTVYRNGWPVRVCSVNGSDGGARVAIDEGSYSVRLRTPNGCMAANADACTEPTIKPTAEPTIKPTAEPTIKPTAAPTVKPTTKPTVEPTATPAANPAEAPSTSNDLAFRVIAEVNAERAKYGLSALREDPELTRAACVRANEIVQLFSHTRPNGESWSSVSTAARGENIAKGHSTVARVMAAWMSSEGHRANILRESFGSIGVCAIDVGGVRYWVQLFGK